ncbi:tetratricopeptide repeat protein [Kitasatospora sp. NPDC059646]|uniref:tetratricopeptide repeat protein n=1 Tax=Kitasatospora sp. NPDC059646 TaxID=3346893 RepID=UPI0036C8E47F
MESAQAQQVLAQFARDLARLQARSGNPNGPQLVAASGGGLTTSGISELLKGKRGVFRLPQWDAVRAFVTGCKHHTDRKGFPLEAPLGDLAHWRRLHNELVERLEELEHGPGAAFDGPAPLAPLKRVPPGFTGRDADLDALLEMLDPTSDSEHAVVVASVLGMGGMGKTTLGLAAGHLAVQRGLFTGVLFLDLHGYDDSCLDGGQALDTALRALGTAPEQIPPDTDQRAALYCAQLDARARADERVLVLADNASTVDQVHHLIPPDGPHRLLVTSRDDFATALGARLVDLDVLTPGHAVELLDTALRLTFPQDPRIHADPAGAARIAELCGHLPLALQIAAAQLAADRSLTPTRLAEELEALTERLDLLEDGPRAVRSVLQRSYRRLAPTHAEVFRLLAVNPGPDLSLEAAAAATGIAKLKDVRLRLVALSRASLIRQDPETRRWRMHDLVRAYADELARENAGSSALAFQRLLQYYSRMVEAAWAHLAPGSNAKDRARQYTGWAHALAAVDAEHANLVAAVHAAHRTGFHQFVLRIASSLTSYLGMRRRLEEGLTVAEAALSSAQDIEDRSREAYAWDNLGFVLRELGRLEEAEQAQRASLAGYRDLGDRWNEARVMDNLGIVLRDVGRLEEAEQAHSAALAGFRALGEQQIASCLGNLGLVLGDLGRLEQAEQAQRASLAGHRALGDKQGEASGWHNLGGVLRSAGDLEQAVEAGHRAVALFQELDDQYRLGWACDELAGTLLAAGRPAAEVRALREEAAVAYRRAGAEEKAVEALAKADTPEQ